MLTSGDVLDIDLGVPRGREAGVAHPVVLVTSQRILDRSPSIVHVVPLTSTLRPFDSEIAIAVDEANGLDVTSAAQCQHIRGVSTARVRSVRGNVGPFALTSIRETIADILDLP